MQSDQSTTKEVKYAQYLVYAASMIYLVVETIALVKANRVFYIPFQPILVCALGFFVGRSLGRLHSGTHTFVIVLSSLSLLMIAGSVGMQWLGLARPIADHTLAVYSYVSEVLYGAIDVLLLYSLTRPHVREAFRSPHAAFSQSKASGAREDGTQDEA